MAKVAHSTLRNEHLRDSLRHELSLTKSPSDSSLILAHILDLSTGPAEFPAIKKLFQVSLRAGKYEFALEALRRLSSRAADSDNDSIQKVCLEKTRLIDSSPSLEGTKMFIQLQIDRSISHKTTYSANLDSILTIYRQYLDTPDETEEQKQLKAFRLFRFCTYMSAVFFASELLSDVYSELADIIECLPQAQGALRNLFYNNAAEVFSLNNRTSKSLEADRKLLSLLDSIEEDYHTAGRIYRNYDMSHYKSYRRLLSNYRGLTTSETANYYNRILTLTQNNPAVAAAEDSTSRARIYYYISQKEFAKALPLLLKFIDRPGNKPHHEKFIRAIVEASEAIGDKNTLFWASREYNKILEGRIKRMEDIHSREIELSFIRSTAERDLANLRIQNAEMAKAQSSRIMITSIFIIVIFIIIAALFFDKFRATKRFNKELAKANDNIKAESNNLIQIQKELIEARDKATAAEQAKTDFINNMGHEVKAPLDAIAEYTSLIVDCIDEDNRKYLTRFAEIVNRNVELLLTLVNDVLEMAESGDSSFRITPKPFKLAQACQISLETIHKEVKPGVTIEYINRMKDDINITTDRQRVELILLNLLSNAAKFTDAGAIRLITEADESTDTVSIIVEDTGIGIPRGKEEIIFERFEKLDYTTHGYGLGLYICRLIVTMLGGQIYLDSSYRSGARFVFTIPIHPSPKNDKEDKSEKLYPSSQNPY